jgi:hypothetical protein
VSELHLTPTEERLAEQYVRVLDFVSRCAQALDGGNWHYLWAKAGQLADAAQQLDRVATQAWNASQAGERPRRDAVAAAVAHWGRHYHAGRLLHPEPHRPGGEPR